MTLVKVFVYNFSRFWDADDYYWHRIDADAAGGFWGKTCLRTIGLINYLYWKKKISKIHFEVIFHKLSANLIMCGF